MGLNFKAALKPGVRLGLADLRAHNIGSQSARGDIFVKTFLEGDKNQLFVLPEI